MPLAQGFLYLVAILDWYSRYVLYLYAYETWWELLAGLAIYFAFYNHEWLHQSLACHTPLDE